MADQYGNPTMSDWLLMSRSISAMNADNQQEKYEDAKGDMVKEFGSVKGVVENADPSQMDQYQLKAYQGFSSDYSSAMTSKRDRSVEAAKAQIMNGIKQAGGDPFAYFKSASVPDTEAGLRAAVEVRKLFSEDAGFQTKLHENRKALADAKANELMNILKGVEQSLLSGDQDTAGRLMEGASRSMPTRRLYKFDGNGGMVEYHMSREEGYVPTGRVFPVNAMLTEAKRLAAEQYSDIFVTEMRATSQFNRENAEIGRPAVGRDGSKYNIYTKIKEGTLDSREFIVYDRSGNLAGVVDSPEKLHDAGIHFRDMEQEKSQADLDAKKTGIVYTKQQTATSKAAMEAHEADRDSTRATLPMKTAKAQADLTKAMQDIESGQTEQARKALDDFLMPFMQKGTAAFDPNTFQLTTDGDNALNDAQATIEKARSGEQVDPARLEAAKSAIALFNRISISHKGKYSLQPTDKERVQIDEMKLLIKQFGPDRAKAILNKGNGTSWRDYR